MDALDGVELETNRNPDMVLHGIGDGKIHLHGLVSKIMG